MLISEDVRPLQTDDEVIESYKKLSKLNFDLFNNTYDSQVARVGAGQPISTEEKSKLNSYAKKCILYSKTVENSLITEDELIGNIKKYIVKVIQVQS